MALVTQTLDLPTNSQLKRAHEISRQCIFSARSMLEMFSLAWERRGAKRGQTTDKEQDLLRAMLVMACAGLDATLKQIIKDALPDLMRANISLHRELEGFIAKKLKDGQEPIGGAKFLAKLFAAEDLKAEVVSAYIYELTGDSLQSHEQVAKSANALGLGSLTASEISDLKVAFALRNKIVHELDINFGHHSRRRTPRREEDMVKTTDLILSTMNKFVAEVDRALTVGSGRA